MSKNFPLLPMNEARVVEISPMDQVKVEAVLGGYAVVFLMAPFSSDDLWEAVTLPVRYTSKLQVEAKARQISKAGKIDLRRWTWQPSVASPQNFMHHTPVADWIDAPVKWLEPSRD